MTSLQFFPPLDNVSNMPPQWSTGKFKREGNIWIPKAPSWHYSGEPTKQEYALTKLKLSNLRLNDQLLPRPQDFDMGQIMIDKPFPAEHPYSSHIPRFSMFPKFDSPEDPKRGVEARQRLPDNVEMPRTPLNMTVLQKTKGHGHRIELQIAPRQSIKVPLQWHDGDNYEHLVKTPSNASRQFYPTPPKIYVPNHEARDNSNILHGDMVVTPRTANALRNLERDQWETTYERAHSGLGPANPNKLDNQDEKDNARAVGQEPSDEIHPHSAPTFDPPRSFEGRMARLRDPDPAPQTDKFPNPSSDPNYVGKPILTEIEEDRLWNGREYVNLPERQVVGQNQIDEEQQQVMMNNSFELANPRQELDNDKVTQHPLQEARDKQHDDIQQMEAETRWKDLEMQTPAHNIVARNLKMDTAVDKSQPDVFYKHEGKYQRERSGLYKTSYDPYKLQYDMNKEERKGGVLFDITGYQNDVLNHPYDLNGDMHEAMRFSRSLGGPPGSVPQLHSQPTPYEVIQPYKVTREIQKAAIQPQVQLTDVRTVEDGLILKESTHNDGYNHQKFLQENDVHQPARIEPLVLMSSANQSLENVKVASTPKKLKFNATDDKIRIKSGSKRLASAPGVKSMHSPLMEVRPDTSPAAPRPVIKTTESMRRSLSFYPTPLDKPQRNIFSGDQFQSRASNFSPHNLRHSWAGDSPFKSQFTGPTESSYLDMGYKNDSRFDWLPGSGTPRPQTSLLEIQDRFSKSSSRKKFHRDFPETNPDLRENHILGRKHTFGDLNAQVLRGSLQAV